jgi:cytochrome c-type biogenesis protein CcmH/NrfF
MMLNRRSFLGGSLGGLVLFQQPAPVPEAPQAPESDELRDPQSAGLSRLPVSQLDNDPVIVDLEHKLKCTCGCNLDIFTCRTTDFTCTYSPALHQEILGLYKEGKTPEQIIAAFVEKYGEQTLMAPEAQGFNLAGYLVPGLLVLLAGGILSVVLLRRHRMAQVAGAAAIAGASSTPAASSEEMERLKRALSEVAD